MPVIIEGYDPKKLKRKTDKKQPDILMKLDKDGKFVIPNDWTSIPRETFVCCATLKEVIIPDSVTKIEESAFNLCSSLTKIELSREITTIEKMAFYYCTKLENLILSEKIKYIGTSAFASCYNLDLVIETSLFSFHHNSFDEIQSLTVYNKKINLNNLINDIDDVQKTELKDKINEYLLTNNMYDIKYFKYSEHSKFIDETIKKLNPYTTKNGLLVPNDYDYREDFENYMRSYVDKHKPKNNYVALTEKEIDSNLMELSDILNNYQMEEFNSNNISDILHYGSDLELISRFSNLIHSIEMNYTPTNTNLENEFKRMAKPRNIEQSINSVIYNQKDDKYYFNKDSITTLIYFTIYNIYRINKGIEKLNKLKELFKIYLEKVEEIVNNIQNYNFTSMNFNDLDKSDEITLKASIDSKIKSYEQHLLFMTNIPYQIDFLIDRLMKYKEELEETKAIITAQIEPESLLNKGIIKTEENIKALENIRNFYQEIIDLNKLDSDSLVNTNDDNNGAKKILK